MDHNSMHVSLFFLAIFLALLSMVFAIDTIRSPNASREIPKHLQLAVVRSIAVSFRLVNNNFTCNCFIHCIKRIVYTKWLIQSMRLLWRQLEIANEQCWKCWDEQIDTKYTFVYWSNAHTLSLSLSPIFSVEKNRLYVQYCCVFFWPFIQKYYFTWRTRLVSIQCLLDTS